MFNFWWLFASFVVVFCANFLWWIFRKNPPTVFFPLAKILNKKPKLKPVYKIQPPNWVHFFSYLFLTVLMLWMFFRPQVTRYFSMDNRSDKILFVADFSASVQSFMNLEEYRNFITKSILSTRAKFSDSQLFYLNTSHGGDIRKLDKDSVLDEEMAKSFFHPATSIWSRALQRAVLDAVSEKFAKIIVISDFQNSSWDGVDVKNFEKFFGIKLFVLKVPQESFVEKSKKLSWNYFIESSVLKLDPVRKERNLELSLGVWKSPFVVEGEVASKSLNVEIYQENEKIHQYSFVWDPKDVNQNLRIQWPLHIEKKGVKLVRIELKSSEEDLLSADNKVTIPMLDLVDDWTIYVPRAGENYMAESWFHLQNAMESLSLNVKVQDVVSGSNMDAQTLEQTGGSSKLIMIGGHHPDDFGFCSPNIKNFSSVVLFPAHLSADYKILCRCIAKQLEEEGKASSWCQNVSDSTSFSELLKSVGGKQQAGNLGESSQAMAWKFVAPVVEEGKSFLVFTAAPIPALYGGHVPFLRAMQFFLKGEETMDVYKNFWKLDLDWFSEVLTQPDRMNFFRTTHKISSSESKLDLKEEKHLEGKVFSSLESMILSLEEKSLRDLNSEKKVVQADDESPSIPYPDSKPYVWIFLLGAVLVWGVEIIFRIWLGEYKKTVEPRF